jgi:hypothetical protein
MSAWRLESRPARRLKMADQWAFCRTYPVVSA